MAKLKTPDFHPGGSKGKLHRELGIKEGTKIPQKRLAKAEHSRNREVRDDAIRAKTMEGWRHTGHRASHLRHRGVISNRAYDKIKTPAGDTDDIKSKTSME